MQAFVSAFDGAVMRYFLTPGEGRVLVMIHGLGCASSYEYPPVGLSAGLNGRPCLMVDLFGHGYSDDPVGFPHSVAAYAEAVGALIDGLGLSEIDLYGHSMGGSVAIDLAAILGARVKHLVISEANLQAGGGAFSSGIAARGEADYVAFGHAQTVERAKGSAWGRTMQAATARAVFLAAQSLVEGCGTPDWRSKFLAHPAQKTYVFGAESLPDPDHDAMIQAGVPVQIVPKAGHAMAVENPAGLATAIARGLSD